MPGKTTKQGETTSDDLPVAAAASVAEDHIDVQPGSGEHQSQHNACKDHEDVTPAAETAEKSPDDEDSDHSTDGRGARETVQDSKVQGARIDGIEDHINDEDDIPRNLFVGNLPYSVDSHALSSVFCEAGTVLRADVAQDLSGRPKGYATLRMSSTKEADKAIFLFHGYEWHGRTIEVRDDHFQADQTFDRRGGAFEKDHHEGAYDHRGIDNLDLHYDQDHVLEDHDEAAPPPVGRALVVSNLAFVVQWQEVKDFFRQVGKVERADIDVDAQGRSKGVGRVLMATPEDAQTAIDQLSGMELEGRPIQIRPDHRLASQVFFGNLPYTTRWQDLKDWLRANQFEPNYAEVLTDVATGRSKGCGFVRFDTTEEAERAVRELNGVSLGHRNLTVRLDKYR
ncbi:Myelin expression factor 2 [Thoreauomyces humboldtii]|nr:Myelin expression factor 2 [Thoreauomyces humboldtii]